MAAFLELFGEQLQDKGGKVPTVKALDGKTAVLVYFSAHWCPPCRGFTPKLAEFHRKHSVDKGFATVFVSGDHDQEQFDEYFGTMPWFALPFDQCGLKETLSEKYEVQGIPTLIVLGPDGTVITKDGRGKVTEDFDECAGFPWAPKALSEVLGDSFLKQDGSTVGRNALEGKTLGLYFSAHWCPPCRGFTPKLKEFYAEYKAKDPDFEIVFVSSDRDEAGMLDYFKNDHGDYLALPYDKRNAKAELSSMFGVAGIPTFAVIGADGKTLNANARGKVSAGANAVLAQGWEPSAVGNLAEGPEAAGTDINETPTIVIMCEEAEATVQEALVEAMTPLAKKYIQEAKESGDDVRYIFLIAKDGGPMKQIKALTQKEAGEAIKQAGSKPVMLLFDIPDNGGFYFSSAKEITTESIAAFIQSKEEGKETRFQLGN